MKCLRCHQDNPPQAKFCLECGTPVNGAASPPGTHAGVNEQIQSLSRSLTEALAQQKATAELLQARTRELAEALEQQTATAEILRVIASSQTDVQPVFEAVLKSAARLCDALDATIFLVDGDGLRLVAHEGPIPSHPVGAFPLIRGLTVGRAVLDGRTIHVPDVQAEVDEYPEASANARSFGSRSTLSVPLLRGMKAIGVIGIRRTEVRPFTDRQIELLETFAAQAVIAIENVRLFTELGSRNRELTESLEQQTATGEILRVIASSPTDLQPVMAAVAENAARLCGANDAMILRVENNRLHPAAVFGGMPSVSIPLSRRSPGGRTVIDRQTLHIHDIAAVAAEYPDSPAAARGVRTMLSTPLLSQGVSIGAIVIRRMEVKPFTDQQIALLQTFADQAVIAIENVRLFNETKEALEQQTATGEILRVIASSPTDIQPVFEAVAQNSARLCEAPDVVMLRVDGDVLRWVTSVGPFGATIAPDLRIPSGRGSVAGRAVVDRRTIHVHDLAAESEEEFPVAKALQRRYGHRTQVAVPLLREGIPLGVINVIRTEVRPFSDKQIALLETFADQAVIAIENVRLFNETKEALEQQTATAEILRAISQSPTDVQPVFDAIAERAWRLCGGLFSGVFRFDGELMHAVADHNVTPEARQGVERMHPMRPSRVQISSRAVLSRSVVLVDDMTTDPEYPRELALAGGWRSAVSVPMLREGQPIGAINVIRGEVKPFSDNEVELLKTFADQAVIAIENVRLFTELEARNRELTEALEQQTATAEILRVIASSPTDVGPVFATIIDKAMALVGAHLGALHRYEGDEALRAVEVRGAGPEARAMWRQPQRFGRPFFRASGPWKPAQILDVRETEPYHRREPLWVYNADQEGMRTLLNVPLVSVTRYLGAISLYRREVRAFTEKEITLLPTFAA
jgi:GAF domain-containing protein